MEKSDPEDDQTYNSYLFFCHDWRNELVFLALAICPDTEKDCAEMLEMFFGCMKGFISPTIAIHNWDDGDISQF